MNCEEYRQALGENPNFDGGAGHLAECADCQAYRKSLLALEAKVQKAIAIPVPELVMPDLPEIDTGNVVTLDSRRRFGAPAWLAMAASVALVAVLAMQIFGGAPQYDSLGDEIIAHLDHEPNALVVTDVAVSDRRLDRVVPANIANLDHSGGLITYAQSCKINGKLVPHLVIQGTNGPVTVLLMPDEKIDEAKDLEGKGINGVLIPVGDGSIAIIGDKDENIDEIRRNVTNSVTWTT
jgi:hypothetical protein